MAIGAESRNGRCRGQGLREALIAAAAWLERQVEELNRLNVFPIPDGDTGTNLHLTMQSVLREMAQAPPGSAGAMAQAAARGALMGARGNSGVILSQLLRGVAETLGDSRTFTAADLARAFGRGVTLAYACVIKPVEGTILTVSKDVAQAADAAAHDGADLATMLETLVTVAKESVERTPNLLPVLREAGVVDAGGLGVMLILEGAYRFVSGEESAVRVDVGTTRAAPPSVEPAAYGYCTEFLLRGDGLSVDGLRQRLAEMGESLLVVSDGQMVRVHVHTMRPGAVLEYASDLGTLHHIKVDNMQDQHEHRHFQEKLLAGTSPLAREQVDGVGVVAVANGSGFADLLRSMGAIVVPGGKTMNPTAGELLRAVDEAAHSQVILLPNHPNIVLNAQQVAAAASKPVTVVRTRSMPQGLAAMLAFNAEADLPRNAAAMERALGAVRTVEVARAVRSTHLNGREVREGQVLSLAEGDLVAVGNDPAEAILATMSQMQGDGTELITVYHGDATETEEAEGIVERIRRQYPHWEVQLVAGGQPLYDYIISLE